MKMSDAAQRKRADDECSERGLCDDLPPIRRDAGRKPMPPRAMTLAELEAKQRAAFGF